MTKESYLDLKKELKQIAFEIKCLKQQLKSSKREVSKHEKFMSKRDYSEYYNTQTFQKWKELLQPMQKVQRDLFSLRDRYRSRHVCYCIVRGKSIEQIEPKNRKNDPYRVWMYLSVLPQLLANEKPDDIIDKLPKESLVSLGWLDSDGQSRLFSRDEMIFKRRKK